MLKKLFNFCSREFFKHYDDLFRGGMVEERRFVGLVGSLSKVIERLFEKKVDYAGSGIVIPDTHLAEGRIGLPEKMVAELYQPMLLGRASKNETMTLRAAKKYLSKKSIDKELLESVLADRPLLVVTIFYFFYPQF